MSLKDTFLYFLLSVAAKCSPPLSERTARRFRKSAKKRAPYRRRQSCQQGMQLDFRKNGPGDDFLPFSPSASMDPAVRVIAHYLPQFHPFEENDRWWGKGFTEWSNVGKALPNYPGHYQPHCPIHFGYYDLRIPEVMIEQAQVARAYGIGGFNYYFYWFDGKTLMERPLLQMLHTQEIDIPFCLTWANENWSRRWDGRENDVLMAQKHSVNDSLAFLRHVHKYMQDPRYIRIDGKPILIVYRAALIPHMRETAQAWREEILTLGEPGVYLIAAQHFDVKDPEDFGFDAALEFPPHEFARDDITEKMRVFNPEFTGKILDYNAIVDEALRKEEPSYRLFRSSMLSWDNTARNQNTSTIFARFSIEAYRRWTQHLCDAVLRQDKYGADEKIIFVNAWNEWAEGTHLEPDRRYGFAYLQATYDAVPKKTK